jgi:hypothetical protein
MASKSFFAGYLIYCSKTIHALHVLSHTGGCAALFPVYLKLKAHRNVNHNRGIK